MMGEKTGVIRIETEWPEEVPSGEEVIWSRLEALFSEVVVLKRDLDLYYEITPELLEDLKTYLDRAKEELFLAILRVRKEMGHELKV